jgi:5-methyltetrahydrofolate--homocysteine methyltransferase
MLIDEKGQAVSYDRKIEIAGRAYRMLVDSGFPPENIVFDPNVLAVATGISEHDACAADFIRACAWIRDNCPGVNISGGISNLSYSFRGNNKVREAMHSVFLVHVQAAGLSMAIVNPAALIAPNAIEENLRNAVEDVILNRDPGAAERLLALTEKINAASSVPHSSSIPHSSSDWRNQPVETRIIHAMLRGIDDFIEADALELLKQQKTALEIIEGPLMDGMKEVGKRFDEGTIYLPHVIRSARVMKKAAAALEPHMSKANKGDSAAAISPKIILATVKGDVHDIGKNIVGIVLACNGYKVIDLGVMVPAEQILDAAEKEQADMIGLSGLIAPSLDEMAHIAREMEKRRMKIPLLVGGAAASLVHTSLRLAPEYSGPVVYVPNAGKSAETVRALLSDLQRPRFLRELEKSYQNAARRHEEIRSRVEIISLEEARANRVPSAVYKPAAPKKAGIIDLDNYPINRVIPYIDWQSILRGWETKGPQDRAPAQAVGTILDDAKRLLEQVETKGLLQLRGVAGIFPASSENEDILIGDSHSDSHRFCFRRNLQKKPAGVFNPCLADFILPAQNGHAIDWMGLFAISAGFGLDAVTEQYRRNGDDYSALLLASLANALAEAFVEELHLRVRRELWGYVPDESLSIDEILKGKYTGIRPAFGYPSCPNHEDKRIAFELLEAEKRCGLKLTDTAMIIPAASVCGMFFASPASYYFNV